jgi:DNA-binding PadR family transcriptional regulator
MHRHSGSSDDRNCWQSARRGFSAFGQGSGPFGPDFRGGRGRGGGAFRIGRMIADGDLRVIVLALLEKEPRHGYDIIKALEEISSGVYSPSPGVVYPTLTFLEEVGYATAASDGNKRVYSITDSGRAHLAEHRELADSALGGIEKFGRKIARARQWWEGVSERGAASQPAPDRDIEGVIPEVNEARRELKAAIADKVDASADEQRRLAGVLRDAAAAIRGKAEKPKSNDIDIG